MQQQDSLQFSPQRDVLTPSRLNQAARQRLETAFGKIWIEGEISSLRQPGSGHFYFALKDAHAQVRCALFRQHTGGLQFRPSDGQQVLLQARVGLYEPRGEFQLIVEYMEPQGAGLLRQQFEALKRKLAAEGLFDANRKRTLPKFPKHIAVVTSPTGAAIRDVLSVLERRYPIVRVTLVPSLVQGENAPAQLIGGLLAAARLPVDVILLTRGGGSLEDLWPFNDEGVVRAIAAARQPVVSAIGHETDVTLADLVADRRAETPSAAAEMLVPDRLELSQTLDGLLMRLRRVARTHMEYQTKHFLDLRRRLAHTHPAISLQRAQERLGRAKHTLNREFARLLSQARTRLHTANAGLSRQNPRVRLASVQTTLTNHSRRLSEGFQHRLQRQRLHLQTLARALNAVNPLAVLERGYSVTLTETGRRVIGSVTQTTEGMRIRTRFADGTIVSEIICDPSGS